MGMRYSPGDRLDTMDILDVHMWTRNYKETVYRVQLRCGCPDSELLLTGHKIYGREKKALGRDRVREYSCASCKKRVAKNEKKPSEYHAEVNARVAEQHALQSWALSLMPVSSGNRVARRKA